MNEQMKELVAMGAAAAANCHPCMDHHLAKCDALGIDREEVAAAVKVGLMVNRGAENAIRKKTRDLLGKATERLPEGPQVRRAATISGGAP